METQVEESEPPDRRGGGSIRLSLLEHVPDHRQESRHEEWQPGVGRKSGRLRREQRPDRHLAGTLGAAAITRVPPRVLGNPSAPPWSPHTPPSVGRYSRSWPATGVKTGSSATNVVRGRRSVRSYPWRLSDTWTYTLSSTTTGTRAHPFRETLQIGSPLSVDRPTSLDWSSSPFRITKWIPSATVVERRFHPLSRAIARFQVTDPSARSSPQVNSSSATTTHRGRDERTWLDYRDFLTDRGVGSSGPSRPGRNVAVPLSRLRNRYGRKRELAVNRRPVPRQTGSSPRAVSWRPAGLPRSPATRRRRTRR